MEVVEGVDMWELWAEGRWAVIPTNEQVRADGTAVMGAGVAKDAANRFPDVPARYGAALKGGDTRLALRDHRLLLVPTKRHWRSPSNLELVSAAARHSAAYAAANSVALVVPALGAGLGGVAWADVEPVLREAFAGVDAVIIAPHQVR